MERRIKLGIIFFLFSGAFIFSQSLMNRLRVPITINGKIGIGYDNNFLRLPDQDICTPDMGTCGDDVERFGVAEVAGESVVNIVEKPTNPVSDLCVTGLYVYDSYVWKIINGLVPSGRGELEITDVNNWYVKNGLMKFKKLEGFWSDAGTPESLAQATQLVREKKND